MENLLQLLNKGGVLMYPLYLCSFIALAIILGKGMELLRVEHRLRLFMEKIKAFIRKGEGEQVRQMGREGGSILEKVLYATKGEKKNLRKSLELEANEEIEKLEGGLPILATIARISPLLGLLGTVVGMIQAFHRIEISGGNVNTQNLAGGIWMALLTTAYGLSLAIPVIVFHQYFLRKIDRIASRMNNILEKIFLGVEKNGD